MFRDFFVLTIENCNITTFKLSKELKSFSTSLNGIASLDSFNNVKFDVTGIEKSPYSFYIVGYLANGDNSAYQVELVKMEEELIGVVTASGENEAGANEAQESETQEETTSSNEAI